MGFRVECVRALALEPGKQRGERVVLLATETVAFGDCHGGGGVVGWWSERGGGWVEEEEGGGGGCGVAAEGVP